MVNLLVGPKGSGKTQQMIDFANNTVKSLDGNVVFIKNSHNDTFNLSFDIRAICMADYPSIRNVDDYTGFIYGMLSCNSDIECIFIDGILKQSDISLENMPRFIERLKNISKLHHINFYLSISANREELNNINLTDCQILN